MKDTVVVSAREDTFIKTFLGEKRWYSIKIAERRIPEIRWMAVYRKELRAITHIAKVASIGPWPDGKSVLNFAQPAEEISHKKRSQNGKGSGVQGRRYTSMECLKKARNLEECFSVSCLEK